MVFKLYNVTKFLQKLARIFKMVYNYIRIVVMKMKKILNIIIIIFIIVFVWLAQVNKVYARDVEGIYSGPGNSSGERTFGWSNKGFSFWKPTNTNAGQNDFNRMAKIIVAAIRNIGIVVSVIALIVIGIKQVTASVEEKSIIKEAMPGYILGLILVVSITFLPTIIYNFVEKLN